jgi:hypothetical protein
MLQESCMDSQPVIPNVTARNNDTNDTPHRQQETNTRSEDEGDTSPDAALGMFRVQRLDICDLIIPGNGV